MSQITLNDVLNYKGLKARINDVMDENDIGHIALSEEYGLYIKSKKGKYPIKVGMDLKIEPENVRRATNRRSLCDRKMKL